MYPNDPNDPLAILRANARPTFGLPLIPDVQTPRALTAAGAVDRAEATPLPGSHPDGLLSILAGGQPLEQYSADDLHRAKQAGLLRMGLAMMAASQQRPLSQPHGLANALQEGLAAGQQGTGYALAQIRAQQLQAARRDIFGQLQPRPGDTPQTMYSRVTSIFPRVLALGDPDLEKSVTQYLGQLALAKAGNGQIVTPGQGGAYFVDAEGNARQIAPGQAGQGRTERDVMGPDGKPYLVTYDVNGREIRREPQFVKAGAGDLTPAQSDRLFFQGANQFQTHAAHAYDPLAGAERNLSTIEQHLASGQMSRQDFMTLTETVQRIVNPGSIVRTATMTMQKAQTQSLSDRLNNLISRTTSGTPDPTYTAAIVKAAREMLNLQKRAFYASRDHFAQTYAKRGVPMEAGDLYDPFDGGDAATPSAPQTPPTAPARLPGESPAAYLKRTAGGQ